MDALPPSQVQNQNVIAFYCTVVIATEGAHAVARRPASRAALGVRRERPGMEG